MLEPRILREPLQEPTAAGTFDTAWNGILTCNVSMRDRAAWAAFDSLQLSNNHLVSDDALLREAVLDVGIGDQIRVRGWLASYTGPSARVVPARPGPIAATAPARRST